MVAVPELQCVSRGEIDRVYGVRYTRRDFSFAVRPEGYLGPRSGVIKYKCGAKQLERRGAPRSGVGNYWSGAKRCGAELASIGATQSAVERCQKILERVENNWSVAKRCGAG